MPLNLYRRHFRTAGKCLGGFEPDSRNYESDELRRGWKKCRCPIYADGALDGQFKRRNTKVSTWYGGLSRREYQRQLVRESLTLSLNDSAVFLYLSRAIDYFGRLPSCNMQVLARAEDAVQHAAHSAQRHV